MSTATHRKRQQALTSVQQDAVGCLPLRRLDNVLRAHFRWAAALREGGDRLQILLLAQVHNAVTWQVAQTEQRRGTRT